MKILSTADWHLSDFPGPVIDGQNARLLDTVRCLDFLVMKAEEEQPDAILIAGDLFHRSQMWASPMLHLIDIAASRLRRLAAVAPTVLMWGTANHDNLQAFENIKAMRILDLYVTTTPQLFPRLQTKSGSLQIAAVPGLDKGYFRTQNPGMDPAEENQTCSRLLGDLILGMGAQVDPSIPSILMAHYSVAGCELDNGQQHIFTQNEVILPREAIAASPFDLVCLGHIHRAQEVPNCGRPVFYSGSINGLTFNEEGQEKGFWIHDLDDNSFTTLPEVKGSRFIETPARRFQTITWNEYGIEAVVNLGMDSVVNSSLVKQQTKDAIVRVHYTCSDELNKQLNRKSLEKSLYDAGAFYVAEIKPVQVTTTLTKQEMSENEGPLVNLLNWLQKEGGVDRFNELNTYTEMASPLINAVSAKMPTGRLSGVFVPRSLEVKNYRSYREATFDFDPISFATVNGPNGVGKSALFMDAISDCLYEETREGEITGWITNGEKSGAITFEFSMGESIWRVVRTRARSGKTTLALQEQVNGQWADRSAEKVHDTQKKIVALLGMDAMTFRCCGLIMQDAYGIFLEADREDRMQVLANILGLGIYEQLEKLAKEKVTETNRELSKAKDKLAELDEKLKAKPGLQSELAEVGKELAQVIGDIADKEAKLKEAEELVRSLKAKAERAEELRKQIETVEAEIYTKEAERKQQADRQEKARKILDREAEILKCADEYERSKEQVTALKAKQPQAKEYSAEEARLTGEIGKADVTLVRIGKQIGETEKALANRAELEKAAAEYRLAQAGLEGLDDISEKWTGLDFKVREARDKFNEAGATLHNLSSMLTSSEQELEKKVAMFQDSNCIDPEKATCRFLIDAIEAKDKLKEIQSQIDSLAVEQDKVSRLELDYLALQDKRDTLGYDQKEHRRIKDLVSALRPKADQATQLSAKAELLANLREQKVTAEEQKKGLSERLASVREWAKALAKELEQLPALEMRLKNLESWAKAKEQLPAARQVMASTAERIAALDREIEAKEKQVRALEQERDVLTDAVINVVDGNRLEKGEGWVNYLQSAVKQMRGQQNELHAKQGGIKAKLEALARDEEERQQVAADMAPLAATVTRYQTLAKAFGQDGIPFSIVRAVVPELSAQANEILGQMTGGKMSLEMRTERVQKSNKKEVNALEIWINDYLWGNMPYKSRSGGQKVRAALSVAFALAELKAKRAGIRLGMLFVDEPSFLDQQGSEVYVDALESIVDRYAGMKVIAISHDPQMKARFPQVITVEDGGEQGSRVRVAA